MTGTVTKVMHDKGFAFVRDEGGLSRFAHVREFESAVEFDQLREGQKVTFEPRDDGPKDRPGSNGLRAVKVRLAR